MGRWRRRCFRGGLLGGRRREWVVGKGKGKGGGECRNAWYFPAMKASC